MNPNGERNGSSKPKGTWVEPIVPERLHAGDTIRVVAPSGSLASIDPDQSLAEARFADLRLTVSYGRNVQQLDPFESSSIQERLDDLHSAFADDSVAAIFTAIGGYNANQLLPYLDWELIKNNPKIFCGYSDITALSCAIFSKTGLVTYSGPHFSTFGMRDHLEQTASWFKQALFTPDSIDASPSKTWTDDAWYADQDARTICTNEGHWVLQPGDAEGTLVGGNLCTLNLLHGTEWMPDLRNAIVFIEDDFEAAPETFDRDLTSLVQQPGFDEVRALLIGRFQKSVGMTKEKLAAIITSKRELANIPVVANVDFGHTDPILTIPVGGRCDLDTEAGQITFA